MMLLWDSSALVKRYAPETGSDVVDTLFAEVPLSQMATTFLVYAETYSVLLRKRNGGIIREATFRTAVSSMLSEVLNSMDFNLLSIQDIDVLDGIQLMETYSLNSADAAILATYLRYEMAQRGMGTNCVLIASDRRLLQAGQAEGLVTIDPENINAADVPAFLASL